MPTDQNGLTVLLGEEDLEVRVYLETALRCQGYSVEVAQNGEEVLARLQGRQTPVSAVVLDVTMLGTDGIDFLGEIRRLDRNPPVILTSGASSQLDVVEAKQYGADDFITKPINPDDLRKALKKAIGVQDEPGGKRRRASGPAFAQPRFLKLVTENAGIAEPGPLRWTVSCTGADSGRNGGRQGGVCPATSRLLAPCEKADAKAELCCPSFRIGGKRTVRL